MTHSSSLVSLVDVFSTGCFAEGFRKFQKVSEMRCIEISN